MITTDLCIFVEKNSLEEFRYRDQCFLIFKNLSKAKQYFMTLQNQEQDAYANLHRTYSGMEHLQPPSMMATGLTLAGAGLTYGASDNKWINRRKKTQTIRHHSK